MKILFLVIFAMAVLSCRWAFANENNALAGEIEWLKQAAIIDGFVWESAKPFYGTQLNEIRRYRILKSEASKPYTSGLIDASVKSTYHTFHFSGVLVEGFFVPKDGFFVEKIEVTSPTFSFPKGLRIGSNIEEVKAALGNTISLDGTVLEYSGESETVTFHFRRGRVIKVQLRVYTG